MSFPKAKLHRFNEDISCAPPPGSYDPKLEEKIKGAVIERSKRFRELPKSSTSSMESLDSLHSSCSKLTTASHPPFTMFRTPQLPKKLTFLNTPRCTEDAQSANKSSKRSLRDIFAHDFEKCLKEKIEQMEKTHTTEIIEKNVEIKNLREEQITQLQELELLKTQHVKEIKEILATKSNEAIDLKNNLAKCEAVIKNEREAYQDRIDQLEVSILSLNENLDTLLGKNNDFELVIAEKQAALVSINDKCSDLENVVKQLQEELDKCGLEHHREVEMILLRHEEEVSSVAQASEMNADLLVDIFQQRIKSFQNDFDVSNLKMDCDFQTVLNDVNRLVEDGVKDITIKVLDTLNIVGEMENKFNEKIEMLAASMKEPNEKLECILKELSRVNDENDDLKVESLLNKLNLIDIQEKHNLVEEKFNKSLIQCKKYQVVLREMESTIEVLSKRLYESETEVERLNSVCVHSQTENAELIKQNNEYKQDNLHLTLMEADIVNQVYEIQKKLHGDLENLRNEANNKEKQMMLVVDEKENVIQILLTERDFYHGKIQEQEKLLEDHQCEIRCQIEDIKRLESKGAEVAEEMTEKLNAQKNLYSLLDNQCREMKKHYEADLDSLTNSVDLLCKEKKTLQGELEAKTKNINTVSIQLKAMNELLASAIEKFGLKHKGQIEIDLEKINELSGQLNVIKLYVQTISDNLFARVSEVKEKESEIESLNNEIEMKNFTLVQVSEEYENMKNQLQEKIEIIEVMKSDNRDYIDGLISELVLEKERCGELERKKAIAVREFDELKSDNIEKAGFIVDLSTQIESLEGVNQQANNMVSCLKMEKQSIEFQLLEARDKICCLKEMKAERESEIGKLTSQVDELSGRVSKQWNEMESINTILGKDQQLLKELEEMLKEKDVAAKESSKCIQDLNIAVNDLETKLSLLNEEKTEIITQLEKQFKKAHNDLVNKNEDIKCDFEKKIKISHDANRELELKYQAMERRKNEYKCGYVHLDDQLNEIGEKLKNTEDELIKISASTEQKERESKLSDLSQQLSEVTAQLKETELKNHALECMVGPFRAQLSQYEAEKRVLESSKESVQKELCDLEKKIAEALGHQNHKQKIRYVTQLKNSNIELKCENDKMRTELAKLKRLDAGAEGSGRRQGLTILVDKENLSRENSPAGKFRTPRKAQSPSCALKERNPQC